MAARALGSQAVSFNQLHQCDHSRVKQVLYCQAEDQPVARHELVKGYEYEKDRYVVVEEAELEQITATGAPGPQAHPEGYRQLGRYDGHGEEKNMDTAVLMEIENLRRASLAALRGKYREVFEEEARSRHREHLFRRIVWRLQALAEGDLSERARKRAHQIARDADLRMVAPRDFFTVGGETVRMTRGGQNRREQDSRLPLPGALLSRKWKGRTILVEVLAEGFRYENRHYPSLSAIAVAVTGTRWNGLAFFGLTRPAGGQRKERRHAEK